jgi:hypothetical protein
MMAFLTVGGGRGGGGVDSNDKTNSSVGNRQKFLCIMLIVFEIRKLNV